MAALELSQPIDLVLLFFAWRADNLHLAVGWGFVSFSPISVEADRRTNPGVNLLLVSIGRELNLAALITVLDGGQHATEFIHLAKLLKDGVLHGIFHDLHAWRASERVHHEFKEAALLKHDSLGLR